MDWWIAVTNPHRESDMTRIRRIEIDHFRGISHLDWYPSAGINCLIGPGDSGKSTILDAIDLCLGARRQVQFTDADFHEADYNSPIRISVTIGELDESMMNMDSYGHFLRGFIDLISTVEDEPVTGGETVLTVRLTVEGDLEPSWTLFSERAGTDGLSRNLTWQDRVRIAPTRIGALTDHHLGWRRGSVLNLISDDPTNVTSALADAARGARQAFGEVPQSGMQEALSAVSETAQELGIPLINGVKAMLDARTASFSDGAVTLHDGRSVPLRSLGVGSTRLLIAGLQRKTASGSSILLMDEMEYGLEPHRIIRLLGSIGAKLDPPPLQTFMSTHSPVALRELSGRQLFVVRPGTDAHVVKQVGIDDLTQGTIRKFPDAFLARSVIVCEGATEEGLVRGLDRFRSTHGKDSIFASGTGLVVSGGGGTDEPFKRAAAFRALGYRVAIVRDDDIHPTAATEAAFITGGGFVIKWHDGLALEEELFRCLNTDSVKSLLTHAVTLHGEPLVNEHIKSTSRNTSTFESIMSEISMGDIDAGHRAMLGKAAKCKSGWYKTVSLMEDVAHDIVGPGLATSLHGLDAKIESLFYWACDDDG